MAKSETYNADCMNMMRDKPDKFWDLAIVDPPYGIGENRGQHKSRNSNRVDRRNGRPIVISHSGYATKEWDLTRPPLEYFTELQRVSESVFICGGNYFTDLLPVNAHWLVWDKVNGDSDFSDCELIWTNIKKNSVRQLEYMWGGFCQGKSLSEGRTNQGDKRLCEKRIHPTQKPVALYKWLLTNYAKPGQRILDTHLGSGSSRIAAHDLGFDFTGYELDTDYFNAQEERFARHIAQPKLFTPEPITMEQGLLI